MGLTAVSVNRRAWTVPEPIGVVAASFGLQPPPRTSSFTRSRRQLPAAARSSSSPATATPLNCVELVKLVHEAGLPDGWVQTFLPEDRALSEAFATDPGSHS